MGRFTSLLTGSHAASSRRTKTRPNSRRRRRAFGVEALETRSLLAVLVADALSGTASTTVTGTVYEDVNSNGLRDGGESGIKDWTVYLDLDSSGTLNTDATGVLEPSTVTNKDGDYVISNLKPGTYRVAEIVPAGWTATSPERCAPCPSTKTP